MKRERAMTLAEASRFAETLRVGDYVHFVSIDGKAHKAKVEATTLQFGLRPYEVIVLLGEQRMIIDVRRIVAVQSES